MLAKAPGFTTIAVLTLALGIGANTALFSIVNGVLLNPLPFPQPEQLVMLHEQTPEFERSSISYPNFLDWQRENSTFAAMAAYRSDDFTLTGNGDAERVSVGMVSANFFSILGVKPALGKWFSKDEDLPHAGRVTILSAGLWRRRFGGAPDVVGKRIVMDGDEYTIVGVTPTNFHIHLKNMETEPDVYTPVGQYKNPLFEGRNHHIGMRAIGRVRPGVTIAMARADLEGIARRLAVLYPDADGKSTVNVQPMKADMVRDVQLALWVLLAAVGFVLLIACVNVANLQLARSMGRSREFAIRAAMGAGQGRVIRQLLTESILVAMLGGALGCLLAAWGTRAAIQILPETLPRPEEVGLDGHVLIFTLAISVLAGIVFGLAPAVRMSRGQLHNTLKESGRGGSGARHRGLGVFVMVEMALALVLLTGAGLMIRSLAELWRVNPGFEPHDVLTFMVEFPASVGTGGPTGRATIRALEGKLRTLPGVEGVSATVGSLPMAGDDEERIWIEGERQPANESEMPYAVAYYVEPDYLRTMGIRMLSGRFIEERDNENSAPVAVIDSVFARKYFPGQNPIGKVIHISIWKNSPVVVGVAEHVAQWGLDSSGGGISVQEEFYFPLMQLPDFAWQGPIGSRMVLRSKGSVPMEVAVRKAAQEMNSQAVMFESRTMDEIISKSLAARRFSMILLSVFAGLALVLSSIGIYGVISYVVGQRTHEIGIRMAMGAQRRDVMQMMLGEGMKMALLGVAVGICAALGLTHLMAKMLFGVRAADPATFIAVTVVLSAVALAACYLPSRRAMRVDPMEALRYE